MKFGSLVVGGGGLCVIENRMESYFIVNAFLFNTLFFALYNVGKRDNLGGRGRKRRKIVSQNLCMTPPSTATS